MPYPVGCLNDFPFYYRWRLTVLWGLQGSPFYGKRCRVVARGRLNSLLVEFEDGQRAVVSRNAVWPWREPPQLPLF